MLRTPSLITNISAPIGKAVEQSIAQSTPARALSDAEMYAIMRNIDLGLSPELAAKEAGISLDRII